MTFDQAVKEKLKQAELYTGYRASLIYEGVALGQCGHVGFVNESATLLCFQCGKGTRSWGPWVEKYGEEAGR